MLQSEHHLARTINPRTQVEILTLQFKRTTANPRHVVAGHHAAGRLECLNFAFSFLAAPAPDRQLIGQVPEQSLEVGQCLLIRSNVW